MKNLYILLMLPCMAIAQVTIKVTSIPSNTPDGASIYLAGNINDWNPANEAYILQPGSGNLEIVIPEGSGTVEFKFTRGSWPTVEGNESGGFIPNRTFIFTGMPQTLNLAILSWEDLGGSGGSTAAANVQILDDDFFMPQLSTNRRIWLYLPPDYETSDKNYPVIYMHDGQNVFDAATSFAGEWEVDETLNALFADGDYGAIVVAIDNGGASRLDEYSPWVNPEYGGGDGDDYMAFVAETLKPYIDANYRTRPEPAFNAQIGSSMGALIATYGALENPESFRKVGSLSPAYWFALNDLNSYISGIPGNLENHRMYFVAGENESATMVANINAVRDNLIAKGLDPDDAFVKFDANGTHSETYWREEFGAVYQYLFEEENLAVTDRGAIATRIIQTPGGNLFAEGFISETLFDIYDLSGRRSESVLVTNGIFELPETLSSGVYFLKAENGSGKAVKVFKN